MSSTILERETNWKAFATLSDFWQLLACFHLLAAWGDMFAANIGGPNFEVVFSCPPRTERRCQNFDQNRYQDLFSTPNFPKLMLFYQDQILRNRDPIFQNQKRDFFPQTKFSKTDTETVQKLAKVSRPRLKLGLLNILDKFWRDLLQIVSSFSFAT